MEKESSNTNKTPAAQPTNVILKMPMNKKGMVFLPAFDPTTMPLAILRNVMKTLFCNAWGESVVVQSYASTYKTVNRTCIWQAYSKPTWTTVAGDREESRRLLLTHFIARSTQDARYNDPGGPRETRRTA